MTRVIFVATVNGWVSFGDDAQIDLSREPDLVVRRGADLVGFFKSIVWNGYVYVDVDSDEKPKDELEERRKRGPQIQ